MCEWMCVCVVRTPWSRWGRRWPRRHLSGCWAGTTCRWSPPYWTSGSYKSQALNSQQTSPLLGINNTQNTIMSTCVNTHKNTYNFVTDSWHKQPKCLIPTRQHNQQQCKKQIHFTTAKTNKKSDKTFFPWMFRNSLLLFVSRKSLCFWFVVYLSWWFWIMLKNRNECNVIVNDSNLTWTDLCLSYGFLNNFLIVPHLYIFLPHSSGKHSCHCFTILFHLLSTAGSRVESWGGRQQFEQLSPDLFFPSHISLLFCGVSKVFPGQLRVSPPCSRFSSGSPPSGKRLKYLPREASRSHFNWLLSMWRSIESTLSLS